MTGSFIIYKNRFSLMRSRGNQSCGKICLAPTSPILVNRHLTLYTYPNNGLHSLSYHQRTLSLLLFRCENEKHQRRLCYYSATILFVLLLLHCISAVKSMVFEFVGLVLLKAYCTFSKQ